MMQIVLKDDFSNHGYFEVWRNGNRYAEACDGFVRAYRDGSCEFVSATAKPGTAWRELAHRLFAENGWNSPWREVDAELTAAAEGEGPVASPAPRLCAVDRLEAAGWRLCSHNSLPVFANGTRTRIIVNRPNGNYCCVVAGDCDKVGDHHPGLNAALESLLSKPVGAVTVAQILGVAP